MTKYPSSKPISHLFDQLPTDMIYYEIFPYLDYDSRVTANLLLPQQDRLRTPLRKGAVLELQFMLNSATIFSLLRKQKSTQNKITRNRLTLNIWRNIELCSSLYQYSRSFREAAKAKALELSDTSNVDFVNVSAYTRKELKRLCEHFLLSLEKNPYICELVDSLPNDEWSAVSRLTS